MMLDKTKIKPIPKAIIAKIRKLDETRRNGDESFTTYYSYLAKINKDLVKITVACKMKQRQWFCKQVAVHAVNSDIGFVKDIEYSLFGYNVGWYNEGLSSARKHYNNGVWYEVESKYYNLQTPVVNKKYALTFSEYKYSAIDKYPYRDILKYLRIYKDNPQVEYLVKLGLSHFATNKTLVKLIGKNKNFRKWIIQNKEVLQNKYGFYGYITAKIIKTAYKEKISIPESQQIHKIIKNIKEHYQYELIAEVIPKKEMIKFADYLNRQKTDCNSYIDYIIACKKLNIDLTVNQNKYPSNFDKWHDKRIEQYHEVKAKEDREARKELYEKFEKIASKYLPLERTLIADDYVCIIAKSPKQLIYEGEKLNHCVGRMNYDQKFANEETLIFFVRNKLAPNTPFVTVEYSLISHKVLQCYAKHNAKPDDNVLEFVNKKWLPYANRKIKKIAN